MGLLLCLDSAVTYKDEHILKVIHTQAGMNKYAWNEKRVDDNIHKAL